MQATSTPTASEYFTPVSSTKDTASHKTPLVMLKSMPISCPELLISPEKKDPAHSSQYLMYLLLLSFWTFRNQDSAVDINKEAEQYPQERQTRTCLER
jgi:hypothetical protein